MQSEENSNSTRVWYGVIGAIMVLSAVPAATIFAPAGPILMSTGAGAIAYAVTGNMRVASQTSDAYRSGAYRNQMQTHQQRDTERQQHYFFDAQRRALQESQGDNVDGSSSLRPSPL